MSLQPLLSSQSVEWSTPPRLFSFLNARFSFTLDPCCTRENATCAEFYTVEDDGLSHSWKGHSVFMNPPYGRHIGEWCAKARDEAEKGALVVGLLPARTDTAWWKDHVEGHADVHFLRGRLKFGGCKTSAPFPSAIVIWWDARGLEIGVWK